MRAVKAIHPLLRTGQKAGAIRFVHDGKERRFYSGVNDLTGDRLSAFDAEAPSLNDTLAWVRSVFRDIRNKCRVVHEVGDF